MYFLLLDESGLHYDGRNAAVCAGRLHALWTHRHLPSSEQVLSKNSQYRDILWANIKRLRTLHMVWGALGALIFSVYLVYDTQVKSVNVIYLVGSWFA